MDTLVLSRLVYQARPGGHSLEAWGEKLGYPKVLHEDFSELTPKLISRCIQDTKINLEVYNYLSKYLLSFQSSLDIEQFIEYSCNSQIKRNGFKLDFEKLSSLHASLSTEVDRLTANLQEVFPPKPKFIREITPKLTKHGTLNAQDFRWLEGGDLTPYTVGGSFSRITWVAFNPGSPQQVVHELNKVGWKPFNKTDGHKDEEKVRPLDDNQRRIHEDRLAHYREFGWSIDEDNLGTLPADVPLAITTLVRWLMLASRVRKMEEWIQAAREDCIFPTVTGIGTWTHRASHTAPNVGNIPSTDPKYNPNGTIYPEASQLGKQLRAMWVARSNRILVGTDADSIQLRVLAHYMNDPVFTKALVEGDKDLGTDAHSLNRKALGPVCNTRAVAKTFIYAWLLGAGVGKVAQILSCSKRDARDAINSFVKAYPGLHRLKTEIIPRDARRGYFEGFDGRKVIPRGDDVDGREYSMLSGYLQNGEAVIMKYATRIWMKEAEAEGIPYWWINWVHDEWQTETEDDGGLQQNDKGVWMASDGSYGARLGYLQSRAIATVGLEFSLNCPLAGQSKFGYNWLDTH